MEELVGLARRYGEAGALESRAELVDAKCRLVRRHLPHLRDDTDVTLGPHLRAAHVRLAEREVPTAAKTRERRVEARIEIDVMQHADADDRVERPFDAGVAFDVADDNLGAVAKAPAADRRGRLADVHGRQGAPRFHQPGGELARPAPELEDRDLGAEPA